MTRSLLEPILELEGIRQTHFFNGRLLSGEDLAREQLANRDAHRRLGRAVGEGVAYGLQVVETPNVSSREKPVVTIEPGVAINRRGDVLELFGPAEVSLVGGGTERFAAPSAFKDCEPPSQSGFTIGEGAYVLVIGPTEGREGRAPASGLGNATASCNARYTVAGVRFRLVELRPGKDVLDEEARLRNRLAYYCFGTAAAQLPANPFPPVAAPSGPIETLRDETLTDCDVPLAVIFWTRERGIDFVDMWAVRRRISRPSASRAWDLLFGDRLDSTAEAMFLQFQDQIEEIVARDPAPIEIEARERFAFLPPAGLVPIAPEGSQRGFSGARFFGREAWDRRANIEGRQLRELWQRALAHNAIDLLWPHAIQVYSLFDRVEPGAPDQTRQRSYVAFTTTAVISPPQGERDR
jgi:hypothetical protein